ncbi:MAG: hypothetical protein KatS3mg118_1342 [Paracoccaceae bacterium]|nr:MAG: hypothetical protein KatS3mg118_1342 [Paracoccaceae bacterium]
MLQAAIDRSQEHVTGTVRVQALQGPRQRGRPPVPHSLYSERHVTFEEDRGAYDQKDAEGFIRINALRLRLLAERNGRA